MATQTAFSKRLASIAQQQHEKFRFLRTIGGNEGDAIGLKEVRLDNNGLVRNPAGLYIALVETLL